MEALNNPLVPAGFDVVWSLIMLVTLAMLVASLVSLHRHSPRLTTTQALIWAITVILVPTLGSILWFAVGRRAGSAVSQGEPNEANG